MLLVKSEKVNTLYTETLDSQRALKQTRKWAFKSSVYQWVLNFYW